MDDEIRRGFAKNFRKLCFANPPAEPRRIKGDADEKPEITDREFRIILPASTGSRPTRRESLRLDNLCGPG